MLKRGLFIWMYSEHIAMLTTNTSHEYDMERDGGERAMHCHFSSFFQIFCLQTGTEVDNFSKRNLTKPRQLDTYVILAPKFCQKTFLAS